MDWDTAISLLFLLGWICFLIIRVAKIEGRVDFLLDKAAENTAMIAIIRAEEVSDWADKIWKEKLAEHQKSK